MQSDLNQPITSAHIQFENSGYWIRVLGWAWLTAVTVGIYRFWAMTRLRKRMYLQLIFCSR